MSDEAVQRTNEDATFCKRSAVSLGYWSDPYITAFGSRSGPGEETRKAPEIHLGYFTRVTAIWRMIISTINRVSEIQGQKIQIVNLGAGYDTLFWRLSDHLEQISKTDILQSFIDIDLPENSARKCFAVRKSKLLLSKLAASDGNEEVKFSRTDLHGAKYHVIAADFVDLHALEKKLSDCSGFTFEVPTLFIAECVFVYIDPAKVNTFLQWISSNFQSSVALINHEQLNIYDKFGQVMLDNLSQRGCSLPGIEACRDKTTHLNRLLNAQWEGGLCWTMNEIYGLLPRNEIERVEKIEFLDEKELVNQLFEHYCVSYGWKNKLNVHFDDTEFW